MKTRTKIILWTLPLWVIFYNFMDVNQSISYIEG